MTERVGEPSQPVVSGTISIGEVLQLLKREFPDVTISKIRFLEAEGLVTPERTASGYRRFAQRDIDQLRAVLTLQRDQYLPLKVIRDHIEAGMADPEAAAKLPVAGTGLAGAGGGDWPGIAGGLLGFAAGLAVSRSRSAALQRGTDGGVVLLRRHDERTTLTLDPGPVRTTTTRST